MCIPQELWLLTIVMLLLVVLPLAVIWINMMTTGLGTIEQWLAVWWLIGLILILAIPLKDDQSSETSNVKLRGRPLLACPA